MISPELIRRYEFFSGLTNEQIATIAKLSNEKSFDSGYYFFREGDKVDEFYLVIDGAVGILIEIPDPGTDQPVSSQLTGGMKTKDITTSTVTNGMVFGWPGLVPPNESNATAKALTDCRVIAIDCNELRDILKEYYELGYKLTLKAAQVIRERLMDLQIESLAFLT